MSTDPSSDELEASVEELAFLASARRGLSPDSADAVRVSAAVAKRTAALPAPTPSPRSASSAPTSSGWWKLGFAAAFAAGTGVAGYHLGFEAGKATLPPSPAHVPATLRQEPLLPKPDFPGDRDEQPEPRAAPVERAEMRRGSAVATASAATSATPAPVSSLEEETRMVARIERALRDQNARFALGLLGELDRSVPGGQLAEEREAARVIAHCQLDGDAAAALRERFAKRYPRSAYLGRIGQSCRAPSESESSAP